MNFVKRIITYKLSQLSRININHARFKYSSNHYKGVQGKPQIKKYNQNIETRSVEDVTEKFNSFDIENDSEYDTIISSAMHITSSDVEQHVFVIQPYIKWGPKKNEGLKPELQLQEAEALIRSLPNWSIEHSMKVGLEGLEKKALFGKGKLEELGQLLKTLQSSGKKITSIFISKGQLSAIQKMTLERQFGLPILDRYSVVIQILRLHATSTEAKLQVAMAEIPYIWSQMRDMEVASSATSTKLMMQSNFHLNDSRKQLLRNRERKLKTELESIRLHRQLLRQKRKHKNYPIVAVVGYTNAGKTSLIKALTGEQKLQPRNQLFATLDVTAHAALLPCKLEVIYMDTVGFMSDIPTGLIECFVATLEDAMLADLIIHVQDLSHENCTEQRKHVVETLHKLQNIRSTDTKKSDGPTASLDNILNVGNKIDCIEKVDSNGLDCWVSSKTSEGLNELLTKVEEKLLQLTNRQQILIKVPMGGEEMQWLYKNSAVTDSVADPKNSQQILLNCIISDVALRQFRSYFVR